MKRFVMFLLFAFLLSGLILAVASGGLRALPRFVADADPALVGDEAGQIGRAHV